MSMKKTATNVKTATSKVATETKSELEIYREELSKFEKELEELQFKRVRIPISKKEEDRIKDLTAQIQKMKDVLDSMNVKQSKPVVEVVSKEANKNIEDERAELTKLVAIAKNENLSKEQRKNAIKQINEN